MTDVPAQYQGYVNDAANQLGIPPSVVAAQLYLESGWNPRAVSPTGAQGLAQFEPGTWSQYGSGSPFDPAAAFKAYVKYMLVLLNQENGNVQNALAAYNAGPGNLPAGMNYADTILANAQVPQNLTGKADNPQAPPATQSPLESNPNPLSLIPNPLSDIAGAISSIFTPVMKAFEEFQSGFVVAMKAVMWLVNPSNWVRIIAGFVGTISLILGLVFVAKAA